jgi:hypothetical protein
MRSACLWAGFGSVLLAAMLSTGAGSGPSLSSPPQKPAIVVAELDQVWQCRLASNPVAFEPFVLEGGRALGTGWHKLSGPIVVPSKGKWKALDAIFYLASTSHGTGYKAVAIDSALAAWIGRGYHRAGWDLSVRDGDPALHALSLSIDAATAFMRLSLTNSDASWRGSVEYRCWGRPYYHLNDFDRYSPTPSPTP